MTDDSTAHLWEAQLRVQASMFRPPARRNQRSVRRRSVDLLNDLFFELLEAARPDLVVEAGAFEGSTSLRAAEMLPDATVIAFEANPKNHEHFTSTQPFEARGVQYLNLALNDEPGPITFHLEHHADSWIVGHSSLMHLNDETYRTDSTLPVTVDSVRMDDTTPDAERVAMWIDVEGATGKVLAGAPKRLANCDLIKVEVEEEQFWEGQALSTDVISTLLDTGLYPIARDIEAGSQYNIVFASSRLLRQRRSVAAIETFMDAAQQREPWPLVTSARAHPAYGKASSAVRRALRRP